MIKRCYNPRAFSFRWYGGRGIKVHEKYHSFAGFFDDLGYKPTPKHTLERIITDEDYKPGNVRWATKSEQARNRSTNKIIEYKGRSMLLCEWAEELRIKRSTIGARLKSGWSIERTLTTEVRKITKHD